MAPSRDTTTDAFHRGDFWLVQPRAKGHRAGMDSMALAACVPDRFEGRLADFGAGAGAVGLAVASRCRGATVTLIEISEEMAAHARLTLDHPGNAHLAARVRIVVADVTLAGKARAAAGLLDNSMDFVVMNPPFNAEGDRSSPDALKRSAHVMPDALLERWLRSAAALVRPRGRLAIIARPRLMGAILSGLHGRFGDAELVPVHPRADAPAIRIVVRARRAARGGLTLMPPLVLHESGSDCFTDRADAINNGRASLLGD